MACPRRMRLRVLLSASALLCFGCGQSGPLYFSEEPMAKEEPVAEIETTETVEIEQPEAKLPE